MAKQGLGSRGKGHARDREAKEMQSAALQRQGLAEHSKGKAPPCHAEHSKGTALRSIAKAWPSAA